ncbi:hypothetical protein GOV09_03660 [Candidatus Woesearchaeota archaeon]|nr:hypothetical protein [Candidatus Woesearchaeota archaeon]
MPETALAERVRGAPSDSTIDRVVYLVANDLPEALKKSLARDIRRYDNPFFLADYMHGYADHQIGDFPRDDQGRSKYVDRIVALGTSEQGIYRPVVALATLMQLRKAARMDDAYHTEDDVRREILEGLAEVEPDITTREVVILTTPDLIHIIGNYFRESTVKTYGISDMPREAPVRRVG